MHFVEHEVEQLVEHPIERTSAVTSLLTSSVESMRLQLVVQLTVQPVEHLMVQPVVEQPTDFASTSMRAVGEALKRATAEASLSLASMRPPELKDWLAAGKAN